MTHRHMVALIPDLKLGYYIANCSFFGWELPSISLTPGKPKLLNFSFVIAKKKSHKEDLRSITDLLRGEGQLSAVDNKLATKPGCLGFFQKNS